MLKRKQFTVPFIGGVETKTDPKVVPPTKLLTLENGVFDRPGRIQKRHGYDKTEYSVMGGGVPLYVGHNIHSDGKRLFVAADGHVPDQLFAVDRGNEEMSSAGDIMPAEISVQEVAVSGMTTRDADAGVCDDYTVIAALKYPIDGGTQRVYISVLENATGTVLVRDLEITSSSGATNIRVEALDTVAHVYYVLFASTKIVRVIVDTEDLGNIPTSASDIETDNYSSIDTTIVVIGGDKHSVLSYCRDITGVYTIRTIVFNPAGSSVHTAFTGGQADHFGLARVFDHYTGNHRVAVCYRHVPTGNIEMMLFTEALSLYGTRGVTTALTAATIHNITCIEAPMYGVVPWSSAICVFIDVDDSASITEKSHIHTAFVRFGSDVQADGAPINNVHLASKAFDVRDVIDPGGSTPGVWVANFSLTQPSRFLVLVHGYSVSTQRHPYVAKALSNIASGAFLYTLPHVTEVGGGTTGKFVHVAKDKGNRISTPSLVTWDRSRTRYQTLVDNSAALSSGGLVGHLTHSFDDHGFAYYPERFEYAVSGTGGSFSDGTQFYLAIYEWTDGKGNLCRSYPGGSDTFDGQPLEVVFDKGGSAQRVDIEVPTLCVGSEGKLADTLVVLYRMLSDGIYRRIQDGQNDPSAMSISFDDRGGAASLSLLLPLLYTTGGVAGNIAPPPCRALCNGHNRVFIVSADRPSEIWPSKQKQANTDYEFSDTAIKRVEGSGINAIAEMDGNIILFRDWDIRTFGGSGPNDFGQGSFTPDRLVTTDVGCAERDSVVSTDTGLIFKSTKGFYSLSRGHQVSYIGSAVDAWNQYSVYRGVLLEDSHQIRYLMSNGEILAYDYLVNQWSIFTGFTDLVDATIVAGKYTLLNTDGSIWTEDDSFTDDTTDITLKLSTAWIRLAGFHGYQRVWWVYLEGEYKSAHNLVAEVAYDNDDTVVETFTAARDSTKPLRFKPGRQLCESIRVTIYDAAQDGTKESFNATGLTFVIGTKPGGAKYRASDTI